MCSVGNVVLREKWNFSFATTSMHIICQCWRLLTLKQIDSFWVNPPSNSLSNNVDRRSPFLLIEFRVKNQWFLWSKKNCLHFISSRYVYYDTHNNLMKTRDIWLWIYIREGTYGFFFNFIQSTKLLDFERGNEIKSSQSECFE